MDARTSRYLETFGKALSAQDRNDDVVRAVMSGERTPADYVAHRRSRLGPLADDPALLAPVLAAGGHATFEEMCAEQLERRSREIAAADRATAQDVLDLIGPLKRLVAKTRGQGKVKDEVAEIEVRLRRIGAL